MAEDHARMLSVVAIVPARDVEEAVSFYERELGFDRLFQVNDPPVYAGIRRGGAEIHFYKSATKTSSDWSAFRVRVGGIEALYADCKRRGIVEAGGELETKPWGFTEFTIADPGGRSVTFYQTPGAEFTFETNGRH